MNRHQSTSARRRRLAALALATAVLAAACGGGEEPAADAPAPAEPAPAEPAEDEIVFVDGVLQPLADGFPDKEITIVVVDDPGTRDSIYATDLAAALEGISPVDIVVSHEVSAQGGTVPMLAELETRPGGPEGYFPVVVAIPGTVTDFHIEPIEEEYGIGPNDVRFLIATEGQPYTLAQRTDAEWGDTFEEFVEYGRANPGKLRYMATSVGGGNDIAMEWLLDGLGIEVNKIPAGGHQEALSAIGAGEGDFTYTRTELARQFEQDGRVTVIFQSGFGLAEPWASEAGSERIQTAESYSDYGLEDVSFGIILGLMTKADVPESHARWLHELFKAAAATPQWQNRLQTVPGLQIYEEPWDLEKAAEEAGRIFQLTEAIVRKVGLHYDQQ